MPIATGAETKSVAVIEAEKTSSGETIRQAICWNRQHYTRGNDVIVSWVFILAGWP
jgi:hypothetical protein